MARKKQKHQAQAPNKKVIDAIASLVGEESRLISWERKLGRVKVNGSPLSDAKAELRKPGLPMLHKEYHEAIMVADMLLAIGYQPEEIEIEKRESPDLKLTLRPDGIVYAEFTRACDEFDEALGNIALEVDARLRHDVTSDPTLAASLGRYSPHIDFRIRPLRLPSVDILVAELSLWMKTCQPAECVRTAFDSAFPGLLSAGATYWCSASPYHPGSTFVRTHYPSLSVSSLQSRIQERIDEKRRKRYAISPLWLFISISESWAEIPLGGAYHEFFKSLAKGAHAFNIDGFDRIVVGVTGHSACL